MAVVAHVVLSGITTEQYDQVREAVGWLEEAPVGGLSHVTWWEGGDCHNMDAWESEEAFSNFAAERLGPGMAKLGVESQPQITFHPAHEVYAPRAVTLTVLCGLPADPAAFPPWREADTASPAGAQSRRVTGRRGDGPQPGARLRHAAG